MNLETILHETAQYFSLESVTKHREARRIAAYLARKLTRCSREKIVAAIGRKHPTSVNYYIASAEMFMARTAKYRAMVDEIERRCVEIEMGRAA